MRRRSQDRAARMRLPFFVCAILCIVSLDQTSGRYVVDVLENIIDEIKYDLDFGWPSFGDDNPDELLSAVSFFQL